MIQDADITTQVLESLRRAIHRASDDTGAPFPRRPIPAELSAHPELQAFALGERHRSAWNAARAALAADPRFEHLADHDMEAALWRFACEARIDGDEIVSRFVERHARPLFNRTCFFDVHSLAARETIRIADDVTLLPIQDADVPAHIAAEHGGAMSAAVVAVSACGTSVPRMVDRARVRAEHALRLLRIGLSETAGVADEQLRFRLGSAVWVKDHAQWARQADRAQAVELNRRAVAAVSSGPLWTLPGSDAGTGEVDGHVNLGLRWFERGQLTSDPVTRLLCLFLALEAILGEGFEDGRPDVVRGRRMMLGALAGDGSPHPALRIYDRYPEVRSRARDGGPLPVGDDEIQAFTADVQRALSEFLVYARGRGLSTVEAVRGALDDLAGAAPGPSLQVVAGRG
jgi:hypothetical protein